MVFSYITCLAYTYPSFDGVIAIRSTTSQLENRILEETPHLVPRRLLGPVVGQLDAHVDAIARTDDAIKGAKIGNVDPMHILVRVVVAAMRVLVLALVRVEVDDGAPFAPRARLELEGVCRASGREQSAVDMGLENGTEL